MSCRSTELFPNDINLKQISVATCSEARERWEVQSGAFYRNNRRVGHSFLGLVSLPLFGVDGVGGMGFSDFFLGVMADSQED